jgi:ubiquitin carboxyl-terminal hydrolase 25/28
MQEAMTVIAEIRDSERLRQFIASGQDRTSIITWLSCNNFLTFFFFWAAGDIVAPTRLDLPRGLNQLGNTCYLNSLLQVRMYGFDFNVFCAY